MPERSEPRSRGVRLSDLDRSKVYRIGYVGRRWEVIGEGAPEGSGDAVSSRRAREAADGYSPRHAAPAAPPTVAPPAAVEPPGGIDC